ncbi:P44/Msp2 family outer membrane protein [Ehrlichia ruminantium]|uniref:MAP1-2 n=2 Tax=Ehrlichia ruminantium TaxID=779 RepID=Q6VCX8_EHRRU|nr:P44/Msp2 family outer membrane protein [Ehrlichia ruminantium]AAR10943.1 MAP1-2 [Ehrlichia ruminantium]QLK55558.1 P44/Msp2 family outer membrane protein [Ehrlichia ruminantium]QLK56474.1 P44/Msp2 family outer membrane protein [Ehrlichia ruminantium]UOD99671.1 P44/Msp2 family outer membrane protein [Ehrlichia ruminantium]CAH58607.1 putative outer membrane protein MAP1-2 [Ehrlichia ruminantium str. Welgevonden]
MKNKLIATGIVLTLLSFIPNISFSEITHNNTEIRYSIYISGQYKPSVSNFSNFSVKETNTNTENLVATKQDIAPLDIDAGLVTPKPPQKSQKIYKGLRESTNFNHPYTAEFQDNNISFGGAIGYSSTKGTRVELEGSYEFFDVKDPIGHKLHDAHRYFALARAMNKYKPFEPKRQYELRTHHTVMRNDGVYISSIMLNGCYDFSINELKISPYMCVGIGINAIEFFDALHLKLAYQGKFGISYPISNNIKLFADGYYYKVTDNKFKNLKVIHVADLNNTPLVTSAIATLNVEYFGGEIGIRFGLKL